MRNFAFLFSQLTLLLILKQDQALSFQLGGPSVTNGGRHSIHVEISSSAFARSRALPTRCDQPLQLMTKTRQRKSFSDSRLNMDIVGVSPEPIHTAFAFATFGPQPFWVLMILLPKWDFTKKIMGNLGKSRFVARIVRSCFECLQSFLTASNYMIHSNSFFPNVSYTIVDVIIFFALVHFFIVSASIVQPGATAPLLEFNDVFDPAKDSQAAFMNMVTNYPNFVAEEWPHVLTWDLFIGRYIWLDGLKRGRWFSSTQKYIFYCD